jgi:hypothetical protein
MLPKDSKIIRPVQNFLMHENYRSIYHTIYLDRSCLIIKCI